MASSVLRPVRIGRAALVNLGVRCGCGCAATAPSQSRIRHPAASGVAAALRRNMSGGIGFEQRPARSASSGVSVRLRRSGRRRATPAPPAAQNDHGEGREPQEQRCRRRSAASAARTRRSGRSGRRLISASLRPAATCSRTIRRRSAARSASESSIDSFWQTRQRTCRKSAGRGPPAPDRAARSARVGGGGQAGARQRAATRQRPQRSFRRLQRRLAASRARRPHAQPQPPVGQRDQAAQRHQHRPQEDQPRPGVPVGADQPGRRSRPPPIARPAPCRGAEARRVQSATCEVVWRLAG